MSSPDHCGDFNMFFFSESIPFNKQVEPFAICDYGCATGQTPEKMLMKTVGNIKRILGSDTEIQLIFNDMPQNDFKSLFLRIHGKYMSVPFNGAPL